MARKDIKTETEFDGAVVIPAYCTFDTVAAIAALRFAGFNPRVVLEHEDDAMELIEAGWAIDIRSYTTDEGSRIRKVWNWLGWDISEPRFEILNRIVYDLSANNGAVEDKEKKGGWLKDHVRMPLSLVDFRQVWNLIQDLEGYSYADHIEMINILAEAVVLALSPISIIQGRELEDRTWEALSPFFLADPKARWYQQGMPWMRAWDKKLGKDEEMPEDWWYSTHPFTLCGFARQMIRAGRSRKVVTTRFERLLNMMCRVSETAPTAKEAWDCISRVFKFGENNLGLVVHSDDSRIPARCWFANPNSDVIDEDCLEIVMQRKEADEKQGRVPVEVIVVVDTRERVNNIAIMGCAGTKFEDIATLLQTLESGRWDLVLKLMDEAGNVQPRLLNGGMSRQLVRTEISEDSLVEHIQDLVTVGKPERPPHFRKESGSQKRKPKGTKKMVDHGAELIPGRDEILRKMQSEWSGHEEPRHSYERQGGRKGSRRR